MMISGDHGNYIERVGLDSWLLRICICGELIG